MHQRQYQLDAIDFHSHSTQALRPSIVVIYVNVSTRTRKQRAVEASPPARIIFDRDFGSELRQHNVAGFGQEGGKSQDHVSLHLDISDHKKKLTKMRDDLCTVRYGGHS